LSEGSITTRAGSSSLHTCRSVFCCPLTFYFFLLNLTSWQGTPFCSKCSICCCPAGQVILLGCQPRCGQLQPGAQHLLLVRPPNRRLRGRQVRPLLLCALWGSTAVVQAVQTAAGVCANTVQQAAAAGSSAVLLSTSPAAATSTLATAASLHLITSAAATASLACMS
jgi:hypothetical protein